jgi:hypothetical protein
MKDDVTDGQGAGSAEESRLKAGCSQDWLPHNRTSN